MTRDTVVKVKNLSCISGKRCLLKDINWEVKKGDRWVVFGMNGCGKTTLLSIIAGFKDYNKGELEVLGESYTPKNTLAIRKKIGWVSSSFFDKYYHQEIALDIVLSGIFGSLGIGYSVTNRDIIRAKELLSELRLGDKINSPFDLMSKGEQQNVLIARALVSNPEILVLDEPGTGLDVFAREYLLSTVKDLSINTDMTIIYVTHYTEEILDVFDQSLLLKYGQVYAKGLTKDIFNDKTISSFLNYPVRVNQEREHYSISMEVQSRISDMLVRSR